MLDTGREILEANSRVANDKESFSATWQEISDNVVGRRSFVGDRVSGDNRMRRIYDTTGLMSGNMLAGALRGILVPSSRWRRMDVDPAPLRDLEEVDAWLDYADQRLDACLADPKYGFSEAATEALQEVVFFGTMGTFVEDIPGFGPLFRAAPLQEFSVENSMYGKPERIFRTRMWKARHIRERFPEFDDYKLTRDMDKSPNKEWSVTQVLHPSKEAENSSVTRKFRSAYVLDANETILNESGYYTNPWQIGRWDTDPGEAYGRCPGITSLSDCKMLNRMSESIIKVAERNAEPPVFAPHELVLGGVNLEPAAMNYYEPGLYSSDAVRPFLNSGDTRLSIEMLTNRQSAVRSHFLNHLIQLPQSPEMSAQQFAGIEESVSRLLVPQLARITNEWISPLLERTLDIMERNGMIPRRPEILKDPNVNVRIHYLSPAIRAQRITEARAIVSAYSDLGPIASVRPDVFDIYDSDFAARAIAKAHQVDPKMERSAQYVDQVRQMRAQQEQQMQEQQALAQGVDTASKLAPMLQAVGEQPAA